jgi:hypothetical protein
METTRNQNEFNMAVSYLNRLNSLFYIVDESSMKLQMDTWFHGLIAIFRELSTEMKEDEIKQFNTRINNINVEIQKSNQHSIRTGKNNVKPQMYFLLNNLELDLRKVLKDSGLQNRIVDDAMRALR